MTISMVHEFHHDTHFLLISSFPIWIKEDTECSDVGYDPRALKLRISILHHFYLSVSTKSFMVQESVKIGITESNFEILNG